MQAIKHSAEGVVSYGILDLVGQAPRIVEKAAIEIFAAKGSAVMTNVPGPRQPVTLAGSRLAGTIGWAPTSGSIGLGLSIFSYAGGVTVGLQVDAGLVPDPEPILDAFGQEARRPREARAAAQAAGASGRQAAQERPPGADAAARPPRGLDGRLDLDQPAAGGRGGRSSTRWSRA